VYPLPLSLSKSCSLIFTTIFFYYFLFKREDCMQASIRILLFSSSLTSSYTCTNIHSCSSKIGLQYYRILSSLQYYSDRTTCFKFLDQDLQQYNPHIYKQLNLLHALQIYKSVHIQCCDICIVKVCTIIIIIILIYKLQTFSLCSL